MDGALTGRGRQSGTHRVVQRNGGGIGNSRDKSTDPANRRLNHRFGDADRGAAEIETMPLRDEAQDREHARPQRGGDQVGRRERRSSATVVDGRVSGDLLTAGAVRGQTV